MSMTKSNITQREDQAIRLEYERHGVQGFYAQSGASYRNPHERIVRAILRQAVDRWGIDVQHVLDLACGSGEVTLALQELGCTSIDGIDPYTYQAYFQRTSKHAEKYTFEQITAGALLGRNYSLIVCSFALHLLEQSRLPGLACQLKLISDTLIIITPHKRPQLRTDWGWEQVDELMLERVRARLYRRI
jgi:2-polyprenyl-3-methyl-5-hydroxy-6-metoxy-1,4-benzoquinol methylase